MTKPTPHMLLIISALFKSAQALKAQDVETQRFVNLFLEYVLYYVNNALCDFADTDIQRAITSKEICEALAPLHDQTRYHPNSVLYIPRDEGHYDNDYTYEYYRLHRHRSGTLIVDILKSPPASGYICKDLAEDISSDVNIIALTLVTKTRRCVSFNTYRIHNNFNQPENQL